MQLNADVRAAFATFSPTSISPSVVAKPECISSGTMATMQPSGRGSTPPSAKGLLSRRDMRSIARRGPPPWSMQEIRVSGLQAHRFAWPVLDRSTTARRLSLSLSPSLPLSLSSHRMALSPSPSICLSVSLYPTLSLSLPLSSFSFSSSGLSLSLALSLSLSLAVSLSLSLSLSRARRNKSLEIAKAGAVLKDQLRGGRGQERDVAVERHALLAAGHSVEADGQVGWANEELQHFNLSQCPFVWGNL